MTRREIDIHPVPTDNEITALAQALDSVDPGDLVIYHRGATGSAPTMVKRAATDLHERGLCLLTQRLAGRHLNGDRLFDYVAVKARPAKGRRR